MARGWCANHRQTRRNGAKTHRNRFAGADRGVSIVVWGLLVVGRIRIRSGRRHNPDYPRPPFPQSTIHNPPRTIHDLQSTLPARTAKRGLVEKSGVTSQTRGDSLSYRRGGGPPVEVRRGSRTRGGCYTSGGGRSDTPVTPSRARHVGVPENSDCRDAPRSFRGII